MVLNMLTHLNQDYHDIGHLLNHLLIQVGFGESIFT